jgi:hypothetical protein
MKKIIFTVLAFALLTPTAMKAASPDVPMAIKQFIDGFNSGDTKSAFAAYATGDITIIDEFAPHLWTGPQAAQNWAADYDKHAAATGVTDGNVKYSSVIVSNIEGDVAYVIVPTVYNYKEKGKAMTEKGNMAFVMVNQSGSWKIRAWTWTGTKPLAAK